MKSVISFAGLAGLAALCSTLVAADLPVQDWFIAAVETADANSPLNDRNFRQGPPLKDGDSTILLEGGTYLYIDEAFGNLVLTDYDTHEDIGVASISDEGYLQFIEGAPSSEFPKFSKENGVLTLVGQETSWFHCPLKGWESRAVSLSGDHIEGCEKLNKVTVSATD